MRTRSLIPDLGVIRVIPLELVLRVVSGHVLVALFPEKNPANSSKIEESGRERLITTSPVPLHGIATIVADGLLRVYFTTESSDMRLGTARISSELAGPGMAHHTGQSAWRVAMAGRYSAASRLG